MGLIYHVIQHVAYARSRLLTTEDVEDIAAEILLKIVAQRLRRPEEVQGVELAADLSHRDCPPDCVKELIKRHREEELGHTNAHRAFVDDGASDEVEAIVSAEEVDKMLEDLTETRGRSRAALSSEVPELSRHRQAARHAREFRRADSGPGPEKAARSRRAQQSAS